VQLLAGADASGLGQAEGEQESSDFGFRILRQAQDDVSDLGFLSARRADDMPSRGASPIAAPPRLCSLAPPRLSDRA
jgi:hypothetical protein